MNAETHSIKVMIVDDNPDDRFLLNSRLSTDDRIRIVGEASSARYVIDQAALLQPDVIVLDMRMPGMSGLEALPELKERCPSARIVAVSGINDSTLQQSRDAGADLHVVKSSSMSEVLDAVLRLSDLEDDE